jgi:outer membrane protein W
MRPVLLFLLFSLSVFAQPFSAGLKAGIPLTDFVNATQSGTFNYSAPNQRYIVGGMAEVRLPFGLGVEFDALYRHLQYTGTGTLVDILTSTSASAGNWEFPLLLKYRFHFPVVRPYVEAGAAWDTLTGFKQTFSVTSPFPVTSPTSDLRKNTTMGVVLGAGVDIHAIVMHISPEIRFTRWNSAQISDTAGLLNSNRNQAEFLVGFTF